MKTMTQRPLRGFTLIELMVGMVIAMLASLAIFQLLNTSEAHKRTTTAGSDAMQNGVLAQYSISRALEAGGSGFAQAGMWACPLSIYNGTTQKLGGSTTQSAPFAGLSSRALPVAPVLIENGGDDPDLLIAMSSQHPSMGFGVLASFLTETTLKVGSIKGLSAGDWIVAKDGDNTNCVMTQISAAPANSTVATSKSVAGATEAIMPVGASANPPAFLAYGVDGNRNLVEFDMANGSTAAPNLVADNIYTIKAAYGVSSSAANNYVESWVLPTGSWAMASLTRATIGQIRAVRLAVVARSALREKEQVSGESIALFADTSAIARTVSLSADERHYRYRVYDVIVPLRNMVLAGS